MSKKEIESTGIDRNYTPPTLKKLIAMSAGLLVWNMMYTAQSRIQIYGQKVLGLDPFTIAFILMFFTIIDIVNDPILARFSDKTTFFTKKYGKRIALIVIGNFGMIIFLILSFIPWELNPGGGLANPEQTILVVIWICFMITFWDCAQTFREVNNHALLPDLLRDQKSRTKMSLIDTIFGGFIGIALGLIMIPLILSAFNAFDDTGLVDNPNAFFMMAIIVSVIFLIAIPIEIWGKWEPKEMREFRAKFDEKIKNPPFFKVIKNAFSDRNWAAFMVSSLQWALIAKITTVGTDYYVIDGLGLNIGASMIPQLALVIGMTIFGIIGYPLLRKFGSKKVFMIGILISILGFFLMIFSTSLMTYAFFVFIAAGGVGFQNATRTVMRQQAIDSSILKHGTRDEAQYNAVNGIVRSTSITIQAFIFAIITVIFGYDATLGYAGNTELARFGLLFHLSIVQMVITIIAGILIWKLFIITKPGAVENKEKLLELGR